MYCPMKFNNQKAHEDQSYCICDKSSCAWWNEEYRNCAITDIAESLNEIRKSGLDINNRY